MRTRLAVSALMMLLAPFVGRAQFGGPPPRNTAGHGIDVPGWWARLDDPGQIDQKLTFRSSDGGFHVTTGPSLILWDPQQTATGDYTVSASFTTDRPAAEAYGLFIGGADLDKDSERYTAFVVRPDGKFAILERDGAGADRLSGEWVDSPAVARPDASGRSSNALAIRVAGGRVAFSVNGTEVAVRPAASLSTAGIVGLRVHRDLDLGIEGFRVAKG